MAKHSVDFHWSATMTKDKVSRYLRKDNKKQRTLPTTIVPADDIPGVYFKDSKDMNELPSDCVHMILTSPPYMIGQEYEKGTPFDEHLEIRPGRHGRMREGAWCRVASWPSTCPISTTSADGMARTRSPSGCSWATATRVGSSGGRFILQRCHHLAQASILGQGKLRRYLRGQDRTHHLPVFRDDLGVHLHLPQGGCSHAAGR